MTTGVAKAVLISIAGTEGQKEEKVRLLPGTTVRDVLQGLKLKDYQLAKPGGGFFAMNDNLYEAATEGQKFFATPGKVEAGTA